MRNATFAALVVPLCCLPSDDRWTRSELETVTHEIQKQIEEIREEHFEREVKVEITDRAGFMEYAKARIEETETPESLAADETIAKLLGLLPHDMDLLAKTMEVLEEQVGGFYDPATDKFYLMDSFTGTIARVIIAHELTHALDDQLYDLNGTLEKLAGNMDREFAYQSVVEGSGTAVMYQWMFGHIGMQDIASLGDLSGMGTAGLEDAPPFVWKPLLTVYTRGMTFLQRREKPSLKKVATDDYEHAFENPPVSSEQILHPDKYWNEDERDDPRVIELGLEALPDGWAVQAADTAGEMVLAMFTTPFDDRAGLDPSNPLAVLSIKFTNKAAEGWGGDRLALLAKDDARVLYHVTLWDTPEDAREFQSAASSVADGVASELAGLAAGTNYGFRVSMGADDEVLILSYVGVTDEEVERLVSTISKRELQ